MHAKSARDISLPYRHCPQSNYTEVHMAANINHQLNVSLHKQDQIHCDSLGCRVGWMPRAGLGPFCAPLSCKQKMEAITVILGLGFHHH